MNLKTDINMEKSTGMTAALARTAFLVAFLAGLWTMLAVPHAHGAGGNILWQRGYVDTAMQTSTAAASDLSGNVFLTGFAQNASEDFFTIKITADGNAVSWTATHDQAGGSDRAAAMVVDSNGDVIVTGYVWSGTNFDFHTIKYNGGTGAIIWQNTFDGSANGSDYPTTIGVDAQNNVYVGGYSQGGSGTDDFMVIKYSPAGANPDDTPIWQKSYNGAASGQDRISALAVGADGLAVSGYSQNASNFDYLTIKYGFDSTQLWFKTYDSGLGNDQAQAVAMDSSGNVVVSGFIYDGSDNNICTLKYNSSNGNVLWTKTYSGDYDDAGKHLFIDTGDDVYLAGTTYTLTGFTDLFTVKYAGADGAEVWQKIYHSGASNTDEPIGIVVDSAGEVFVAGNIHKSAAGDDDYLVIKYKKDNGNQLWLSTFDGTASKDDKLISVSLGPDGHILAGGWTDKWTAGASDYDYHAIKYDAGLINAPTNLGSAAAAYTTVALSWTDNAANEDGFKIWRRLGELGSWSQIGTVSANVTTYTDTGVSPGAWYSYKVQSYNAASGDSLFSNDSAVLTIFFTYQAPAWSYIYNNSDNGDDYAYGIGIGPDNHPVVTGTSLTDDNGTYSSQDYHTVKLNRADASEMWSVGYNDVDDEMDIATCVVVDNNNDVIVSGYSSLYGGGASNTNDIYTLKYPSTGPPQYGDPHLWDDQYNGPAGDDDRSEAIDASRDGSNNIFVTGYGKNGSGNDDIYLIKINSAGTRLWAATPYDGGANDYPAALAVDGDGNVIVTGKTNQGGDYDIFTRKYNGSTGNTIWTAIHDSTNGWDEGRSLAVDSNGDVLVAGVVVNGAANDDWYIVKYDGDTALADGDILWYTTVDGPEGGDDVPESVRVDVNDDAVLVGGTILSGVGNNDFHVRRYKSGGGLDWATTLERVANDDNVTAMGIDISGNVCLAGNTDNGASIDLLTIKYDNGGNVLGATLFNGAADNDDDAFEVAVNGLGEQFVAGYSTRAGGDTDYLVLRCEGDALQAPSPFTVSPYYTSVDLSWTDTTSDEDGFYLQRKLGSCDSASEWTLLYSAAAGETSHADTGLNKGTTFCYRIQTYKNSGAESAWLTEEVTTTEPQPPSGFTATPADTTRISLAWTDNTTGEDGFLIERCTGSGCSDFSLLALTGPNVTAYNDDSVCESTTYSYKVLAYKTGDWQSVFSSIDADNTTPAKAAPTGFSAARVSEGELQLSWTDNTSDESGFTIERCAGGGCSDYTALTAVAANVTSYNDTASLAPDTTYRYRINSAKSASCGWTSAWATGAEAVTTLIAPTGLTATPADTTQVDLAWTDNTGFENGFVIQRCAGAGCSDFTLLTAVGANVTTYNDTSVCEANTYNYQVRATRSSAPAWDSSWSNTDEAATSAKQAPDTLAAGRISEERILLTWNDTSGDESGFKIERCAGGGCSDYTQITTVAADTTSYTDLGLTPDTSYSYRIRSYKTSGCAWDSAYSNTSSATTTLNPPGGLAATAADTTTVSLTWTDNTTHETGFSVERCAGAACADYTELTTTAADASAYTDSGACNNTEYNYRVRAIDEGLSNAKGGCWTRKAPLTISGFAAGKTIRITVAYDADMQADFADLRFYDETAREELAYWLPKKTDSTSATFWIKAGASDAIAMYYGNGSATSSSSQAPFGIEFADTFAGTTIDTNTWIEIDPNNSFAQNDDLIINDVSDAWDKALFTQQTFARAAGRSFYVDLTIDGDTAGNNHLMTGWRADQNLTNPSYNQFTHNLYWSNTSFTTYQYSSNTGTTTNPGYAWNTSYEMKIDLKAAGAKYYQKSAAASIWTLIRERNENSNTPLRIGFAQYSHQVTVHFVAVASDSTLLPEARATAGAEETDACYTFVTWQSLYSNAANVTTPLAAAPSALTATAISESQIDLTWTDNAPDETGFKIERCEGGGCSDYTVVGTVSADTTSYSDTGLTLATSYSYKVQSYKDAGCGWDEFYAGPATESTLAPPAPSALGATAVNTTRIDLAWTDNTGAETGFSIERCAGAGCNDYTEIASVGENITVYSDTAVSHSTPYSYQIKAVNSVVPWNSAASNSSSATTATPVAPSGLAAARISEIQIDLAWTDNTADESEFRIERGIADCTGFTEVNAVAAGQTTYSDTGLDVATTYCYRVRAYKSATNEWYTAYSNSDAATTTVDSPGGLSATAADTTAINLAWTDTSSSETGFEIERCSGAGCSDYTALAAVAAGSTAYADTDCVHSTEYRYRVRAVNSSVPWNSEYSNTDNAVTPTPAAPSGLSVTWVSEAQLNLAWTDNTADETSFRIERCSGAGCSNFAEIATVGSNVTAYQNTGLTFATSYTYQVRAYKSAANEWYTVYSSGSTGVTTVAAPTGLGGSAVNTTRIDLSWTDTTVTETGFEIERCSGAGCSNYALVGTVGADSTSYNDQAVCNSQTYSYRNRAVKGSDWNSPYSNVAADITTPGPTAPSGLSAVSSAQNRVDLTWSDTTNDETVFKIERCSGAGCSDFVQVGTVAAGMTTYSDTTGVDPSLTYCYRVRAGKSATCSWDSDYSNTSCDLTIQAAPTVLNATALNSMTIQLTWTDNAADEDNYEVYQLIWNGKYVLMDSLVPDTTSYVKTFGIDPGKEYTFKVRAVRGSDVSAFSNGASATTPAFQAGDATCEP